MKKFSFKKNTADKHLKKLQKDLHQLYCSFDTTMALSTLRCLVKNLVTQAKAEDLLQVLQANDTTKNTLVYAVPCLCKVNYTVTTDETEFEFSRYYIAYGVTEYDIDAYLDFTIQEQLQEFDEGGVEYEVEEVIPCIR